MSKVFFQSENGPQASGSELRQSLSALMDGALEINEARFLLRRLESDQSLVATWSSYHLVRECIQGRPAVRVSPDFAGRVMDGLAAAPVRSTARPRWLRMVAGGAIAASVAAAALLLTRPPLPDAGTESPTLPASDSIAAVVAPQAAASVSRSNDLLLLDHRQSPWLNVQPAAAHRAGAPWLYPQQAQARPDWLGQGTNFADAAKTPRHVWVLRITPPRPAAGATAAAGQVSH